MFLAEKRNRGESEPIKTSSNALTFTSNFPVNSPTSLIPNLCENSARSNQIQNTTTPFQ
jgi:hypothetical protein